MEKELRIAPSQLIGKLRGKPWRMTWCHSADENRGDRTPIIPLEVSELNCVIYFYCYIIITFILLINLI